MYLGINAFFHDASATIVDKDGRIIAAVQEEESPWEEVLYDALARKRIKTIPQYPLYQCRLDLAIVNSKLPIDIEIDGEMWHRDIDGGGLLSDLKRDQHLVVHGWQVKRFWVYQLQNNIEQCVQEVKELIKLK